MSNKDLIKLISLKLYLFVDYVTDIFDLTSQRYSKHTNSLVISISTYHGLEWYLHYNGR